MNSSVTVQHFYASLFCFCSHQQQTHIFFYFTALKTNLIKRHNQTQIFNILIIILSCPFSVLSCNLLYIEYPYSRILITSIGGTFRFLSINTQDIPSIPARMEPGTPK